MNDELAKRRTAEEAVGMQCLAVFSHISSSCHQPTPAFGLCVLLGSTLLCSGITDANTNGMSDVWETAYSAMDAEPTLDPDADGQSNLQESVAGTDPLSSDSVFRVESIQVLEAAHLVRWNSVAGKHYQVESLNSLTTNDWISQGPEIEGTGEEVLAAVAETSPPILSLRVRLLENNPAVVNGRPFLQHADTDLDGSPDIDEWAAGTNPFDAGSQLAVKSAGIGSAILLEWPSVIGKQYQVEITGATNSGAWSLEGGAIAGTGESITAAAEAVSEMQCFRVSVTDSDSDSDSISDWEEKFTGLEFGPLHYRTNFPTDPAQLTAITSATNVVSIEPSIPVANATKQRPGGFRVTRAGNLNELTINYIVSGDAIAGEHYAPFPGSITLAPGQNEVEIPVVPLSEAGLNPARNVGVTLLGGPDYGLGSASSAQVNVLREVALSVRDFGAVGDGITDDTVPIQAAIDTLETSSAFNTLHFPAGRYRLNTPTLAGSPLTFWQQLLVLGNTDLAGRDILFTGEPGAELHSTVSWVRTRMLVVHARFRSLTFHDLAWSKNGDPLPETVGPPNGAEGVAMFGYDLRRIEAVDFLDCVFMNCHAAVVAYHNGYDTRGKLAHFGLTRCAVLNPYGSNTKNGQTAFGGGVQVGLNQWIGHAVYTESLFDGGTNGPPDPVRNPGGERKDGSHFGSPQHLTFTNNIVRHMRVEALYQTDDPVMGVLEAPFVVPPSDGVTTVDATLKPTFFTTYTEGQTLNFRTPATPWSTANNVLLTVVSYDGTNRLLTLKNDGLTADSAGTTVPAPIEIYLQSDDNASIAHIMGNVIEDETESPTGLLAIGANARATISGNFIRNYTSGLHLYDNVHNILFSPRPGTLIQDNVILARDTSVYPFAWGIWSHGPEEIIAHNLIVAPNSRRFVGVVTRGEDAWVEGNTALAVNIERWPYNSAYRSVGIAAGNTSSNTTHVANWTYGLDVGNGPESAYQSPPRRVISHFSTNDTLAIDPRGLMP